MVGPDHARPGLYNHVPRIHTKNQTQAFSGNASLPYRLL